MKKITYVKYFTLILLCFFIVSCFHSASSSDNSVSLELQLSYSEYADGVVIVSAAPINLGDNVAVLYKIAQGVRDADYFGCQGFSAYPDTDDNCVFAVSDERCYTVYVRDSGGNTAVKSFSVDTFANGIFDYITCEQEHADEIVTTETLSIDVSDSVSVFKLFSGAKTISECVNADSSDILTSSAPYEAELSKNAVYTLFVETDSGKQYNEIYYVTNIDDVKPVLDISYASDTTDVSSVMVIVSATSKNGIKAIKWLSGAHEETDFSDSGENITASAAFEIAENGIYTVYAEDIYGLGAIEQFEVLTIANNVPAITIAATPAYLTNGSVSLSMETDFKTSSKCCEKYANGVHTADWFETNGTDYEDAVIVTENGTFTFYAKNTESLYTVKQYTVSNIDTEPPVISEVSCTTDVVNSLPLTAAVTDNNAVSEVLLAEGNCTAATIESAYSTTMTLNSESGLYTCTVYENGTYTIGAKDSVGNISVKHITVTNIDTDSPGQVSSLSGSISGNTLSLSWTLPSDDDIAGVRVSWYQDFSAYTDMQEVELSSSATSYSITLTDVSTSCMVYVNVFDAAGNYGTGAARSFSWE